MTDELSAAHLLWRLLPATARRSALLRATTLLAPRPDRSAPAWARSVTVAGEIGRASGLGQGARLMADAIAAMGVPVARRGAGVVLPGEARELGSGSASADQPGALLIAHVNPPALPAAFLQIGRQSLRGRRVVGFWAWELPVAPAAWRRAARLVHEVWVPSQFVAAALQPLRPERIRVVPHPLASAPPRPSLRTRAEFGLSADAVLVLASFSIASSFERKNPLGAVTAFKAAFGNRRDRHLLLKVGKPGHFPADMRRLSAAVSGSPNITVDTNVYDPADTHALTRSADIVLSLHRSEGFGLVPAEAMMLGRAVIATDWSATAEYLDASCGVPVPARLVPARDPRAVLEAPGAVWAEPDVDVAADALRVLADDPSRRARLGAAAMARASERFGDAPLRAALEQAGVAIS